MEALRGLELNNNLLYRLEDLTLLRKCLPNLSELNLRNNAVCEVKSYPNPNPNPNPNPSPSPIPNPNADPSPNPDQVTELQRALRDDAIWSTSQAWSG